MTARLKQFAVDDSLNNHVTEKSKCSQIYLQLIFLYIKLPIQSQLYLVNQMYKITYCLKVYIQETMKSYPKF